MLAEHDPRHGTQGGYTNHGCRCDECRAAQSRANKAWRDRTRKVRPPAKCAREGCNNLARINRRTSVCEEHARVHGAKRLARIVLDDSPGTWYVYRLLDAAGECIYIGCSDKVWRRLASHHSREWGAKIATITLEGYEGRLAALRAEAEAITTEAPTFNVNGNPHGTGRVAAGTRQTQVLAALAEHGPMTQGECERHVDAANASTKSFVGAVLVRLVRSGQIVVVAERPGYGPWATTRVYGLPGQEVAA